MKSIRPVSANIRPHPGSLPQEREKRSTASEKCKPVASFTLPHNEQKGGYGNLDKEKFLARLFVPLSPGERDRVRASDNQSA